MKRKVFGVMPYDPVTEKSYINAVGTNKTEAATNLSMFDLDEDALLRITMVDIEISFEVPSTD